MTHSSDLFDAYSFETGDAPQLIFFTELDPVALIDHLDRADTLTLLSGMHASVALALTAFDDMHAQIVRRLRHARIATVAWLCLPLEDGFSLNLTNYPRILEHYGAFHEWATTHNLHFDAIGLSVEPPADGEEWTVWHAMRSFARGLWLARDNALYPSAHNAYVTLLSRMRHDGYEVHAYQHPVIADDRRVGTTLVQRALDIVDLPADVDVLGCDSAAPIAWLGDDLGGALIGSYGPNADAIAVGALDISEPAEGTLPWRSLRRDLVLAGRYTDVIYIASLEHCVRTGILGQIAALDWDMPARPALGRLLLVDAGRTLLLLVLASGRWGRVALAWAGWAIALFMWVRGRRSGAPGRKRRHARPR